MKICLLLAAVFAAAVAQLPLPGPGCPAPGTCMKRKKCPKGFMSAGSPKGRCPGRKMRCCVPTPTKGCDAVGGTCFPNNVCPAGWVSAGGKSGKCVGDDLKCCLLIPPTDTTTVVTTTPTSTVTITTTVPTTLPSTTVPPLCAAAGPEAACLKVGDDCPKGWVSAGPPGGKCPGAKMKCCLFKPFEGCENVGGTCQPNNVCPAGWVSAGGKSGKCVGEDLKCCLLVTTTTPPTTVTTETTTPTTTVTTETTTIPSTTVPPLCAAAGANAACLKVGDDCPKGWISAGPPAGKCPGEKMKCCLFEPTKDCDEAGGSCFPGNACPTGFDSVGGAPMKCVGEGQKCCAPVPTPPATSS